LGSAEMVWVTCGTLLLLRNNRVYDTVLPDTVLPPYLPEGVCTLEGA
ncbi:MAG: hypothetical protein ACI8X5_003055, partial [Planctomycetota bacterium]